MFRYAITAACMFASTSIASAHFVFIVPEADGHAAKVIMSEDLKPDEHVPIAIIGGTKLTELDTDGQVTSPTLNKADHAFAIALSGTPRIVHGVADLGVVKRGEAKPGIIVYYPKTIIGNPFDAKPLGDVVPMELVPTGKPGDMKLQFLFAGKPVVDAEVDVISPSGSDDTVKTDKDGFTPTLKENGRYGAWARHVEETAGEQGGKHYDEIRKYATLVIDTVLPNPTTEPSLAAVTKYTPMPQAVSSFGAVVCDGSLYVYGGHVAKTHSYSTEAVSHELHRLNLADANAKWETLANGPGVQGMNLATYDGKIYRVGGMEPRNKPGTDADNYSLADVAVFDPKTNAWSNLPPLPAGRSSHDIAIVDSKLFVIGGWTMKGDAAGEEWTDAMEVLDLKSPKLVWQTIKQPFQRRALTVAANGGKIYVFGGFTEDSTPSHDVDIYNVKANAWTKGPALSGQAMNGFAPSAGPVDGKLYVSVADGSLYRLEEPANTWTKIAKTTPRIVGRLVGFGSKAFILGGADKGQNFDLIEVVDVTSSAVAQR